MPISPAALVAVIIAVVIFLLVSFLRIRKGARPPVQLDLFAGGSGATPSSRPSLSSERALNAFFNYNGHAWDAFEALGIPAGSSAAVARAAFERAVAESQPETRAFLEEALKTVERLGR